MTGFASLFVPLLGMLLALHALCDLPPLQSASLSLAKRGDMGALLFHAAIHGLGVGAASMFAAPPLLALALGLGETAAHAGIDFGKCRGRYGTLGDQALHFASQIVWALIATSAALGTMG